MVQKSNPLQIWHGVPRETIEFPSRGYLQQVIRKDRILRRTKDALQDQLKGYILVEKNNAITQ